jgi:hypothetical protein
MSSHNQYTKYGIVIFVGTVSVILFQICSINFISAKAVSLIPIKSDNVTLDRGLPKFYNCIEQAVKHSVNTQKDPYFKAEPTKNEVIKCYYKVLVKSASGKDDKGN